MEAGRRRLRRGPPLGGRRRVARAHGRGGGVRGGGRVWERRGGSPRAARAAGGASRDGSRSIRRRPKDGGGGGGASGRRAPAAAWAVSCRAARIRRRCGSGTGPRTRSARTGRASGRMRDEKPRAPSRPRRRARRARRRAGRGDPGGLGGVVAEGPAADLCTRRTTALARGQLQQRGSAFDASTPEGSSTAAESAGAPESGAPESGASGASDFSKRDDEEGKDPLGFATARIASASPRKYAVREASARSSRSPRRPRARSSGGTRCSCCTSAARADWRARAPTRRRTPERVPACGWGRARVAGGRGATGHFAGHFASLSVGGEVSPDGSRRGSSATPNAEAGRRRRRRPARRTEDAEASRVKEPRALGFGPDAVPRGPRRPRGAGCSWSWTRMPRASSTCCQRGPCGPTPRGETPAGPAAAPSAARAAESKNGRFFTLFLTDPAAGARALCGLSGPRASARERESPSAVSDAERALERAAGALLEAEAAGQLNRAWVRRRRDPFTRRFTAHFVLCRAPVAAHATTKGDEEESGDGLSRFAPTCSPPCRRRATRARAPHAAAFAEALARARVSPSRDSRSFKAS